MKWGGRLALLVFMALAILSPAGVADCGGEYDPFDKKEPQPSLVPWTPQGWGGSWSVPSNCVACHG